MPIPQPPKVTPTLSTCSMDNVYTLIKIQPHAREKLRYLFAGFVKCMFGSKLPFWPLICSQFIQRIPPFTSTLSLPRALRSTFDNKAEGTLYLAATMSVQLLRRAIPAPPPTSHQNTQPPRVPSYDTNKPTLLARLSIDVVVKATHVLLQLIPNSAFHVDGVLRTPWDNMV